MVHVNPRIVILFFLGLWLSPCLLVGTIYCQADMEKEHVCIGPENSECLGWSAYEEVHTVQLLCYTLALYSMFKVAT